MHLYMRAWTCARVGACVHMHMCACIIVSVQPLQSLQWNKRALGRAGECRCNLLYVSTVLVGFIFLPKNVMLIIGVLTSVCDDLFL